MNEDVIQIQILFFASLKDAVGRSKIIQTISNGTTIDGLKKSLITQFPRLAGRLETCLTAVDRQYITDTSQPINGSEIAFFPPVSGGASQQSIIQITREPLDANLIIRELSTANVGGISIFIGTVRGNTSRQKGNFKTVKLQYEAFEEMAIEKMNLIESEIRARWKVIEGVVIIQRTGTLTPGTPSVIIACSASHRDSGIFEATKYAIDRLKQIVPVWKKEISQNGEEWIEGDYHPGQGD